MGDEEHKPTEHTLFNGGHLAKVTLREYEDLRVMFKSTAYATLCRIHREIADKMIQRTPFTDSQACVSTIGAWNAVMILPGWAEARIVDSK